MTRLPWTRSGGQHSSPVSDGAPCCWVIGGKGPMCLDHERAVGEAAQREAATLRIDHASLLYPESGRSEIDQDRPDSATPGQIDDRGEAQ